MPSEEEEKFKAKSIEILGYENVPTVRLSREDFVQMLNEKSVSTYYVRLFDSKEVKGLSDFIILYTGFAFITDGLGYSSIDELGRGKTLGFEGMYKGFILDESKDVVISKKRNYSYYREESNISDGYLYHYAKRLGYSDFTEFNDSVANGFHPEILSANEYRTIKAKGFIHYNDYERFSNSGFKYPEEYREAVDKEISSQGMFNIYKFLHDFEKKLSLSSKDQVIVYLYLTSSKEKTIKLDNVVNSLKEIEELITRRRGKGSMKWYEERNKYKDDFDEKTRVKMILQENSIFQKLGMYDEKTETFNKFIGVPLFIDGSNVAYNNGNRENGDKPSVRFINMVIESSKKYGFSDIRVLHDANLQYVVDDKKLLEKLQEEYKVIKVPGSTDADEFLIPMSKNSEGFIISNDQFRDYIKVHPEDEEYIRTHRIAFLIDESHVIFNNSKYIENAPMNIENGFERLNQLIKTCPETEEGTSLWWVEHNGNGLI